MFNISKNYIYVIIAIAAIFFFSNPSINDFKGEIKASYSEADGKTQVMLSLLSNVGSLQISRKSYVFFSVFKVQAKSIIGDDKPNYSIGFLGNISRLDEGELLWLTNGKYGESKSIKAKELQ